MKEKYRFSLHTFSQLYINSALMGIGLVIFMIFIMFIIAIYKWKFEGLTSENSGVLVVSTMLFVLIGILMIIYLFKIYIDKGIIKCKTRELLLEDNRFIYINKKGKEYSFEWEDITKLKLTTVKMGYRLSVILPQFRFSFFSYEFVLNPIRFKDTFKMKGFEDDTLFHILEIFYKKAENAEFKKDLFLRRKKFHFEKE
jgi:hypothetical protein